MIFIVLKFYIRTIYFDVWIFSKKTSHALLFLYWKYFIFIKAWFVTLFTFQAFTWCLYRYNAVFTYISKWLKYDKGHSFFTCSSYCMCCHNLMVITFEGIYLSFLNKISIKYIWVVSPIVSVSRSLVRPTGVPRYNKKYRVFYVQRLQHDLQQTW